MIFIAVLFLLASVLATLKFFKHTRISTFIASVGVFMQMHWLFATLIQRTTLSQYQVSTAYTGLGIIFVMLWLSLYRQFNWPLFTRATLRKEVPVLIVLLLTVASGLLVVRSNGYSNQEWVVHGFYNGDTVTFTSLIQSALINPTLAQPNVFAAGTPLEYPTLLHTSWASFLSIFSLTANWLALLPYIVLAQIILTVPLFFLLWDAVFPEPAETFKHWLGIRSRLVINLLQGIIVLYVMALSWDTYIYPQGHFFLMAPFLLLIALLVRTTPLKSFAQSSWLLCVAIITAVLLLSNAVTGTAALASVLVLHLVRANDKSRPVVERVLFFTTIALWILLFVLVTPGNAAWGRPGFSYTAASDMTRLSLIVAALAVASLTALGRQNFLSGTIALLLTMAVATFIFSTRNIIIDNASRFFYHACLVGFPLLLGPLLRVYYYIKRELWFTSRSSSEILFGAASVLCVIILWWFPAVASVMQSHDALLFKDETRVSTDELAALAWIKDQTKPSDVFLSDPQGPWLIPQFTGRALLRSDYWLSPNDQLLEQTMSAFKGNNEAQREVAKKAQYLYLKKSPGSLEATSGTPIFDNTAVSIFALH